MQPETIMGQLCIRHYHLLAGHASFLLAHMYIHVFLALLSRIRSHKHMLKLHKL